MTAPSPSTSARSSAPAPTSGPDPAPVAVVTGGTEGLGLELARALLARGWAVVIDGRRRPALDAALAELTSSGPAVGVRGDVADPAHRRDLVRAATALGTVRLVVNNASTLGVSPLRPLTEVDPSTFARTLVTNVVAPVALVAELADDLPDDAVVVGITSDAAVEAYETWGPYGASKAALDHAGRVLAAEHPTWRVLSIDPGDMRTRMHQDAFPGEDISDRPQPAEVVPAVLALIEGSRPSGRYRAAELAGAGSGSG